MNIVSVIQPGCGLQYTGCIQSPAMDLNPPRFPDIRSVIRLAVLMVIGVAAIATIAVYFGAIQPGPPPAATRQR